MSDHMMRKVPRNDNSQSRTRMTRVQQQVENTHILVESSVPAWTNKQPHPKCSGPKIRSGQGRYMISIDENDGSNIDVVVSMRNQQETASIRHGRPEHNQEVSNIVIDGKDEKPSQSRIRIEKDKFNHSYEIKYSNINGPSHFTPSSHFKNDGSEAYNSTACETVHTIRISENNHNRSQRCFNNQNHVSQPMFTSNMRKDREEKSFMLANDAGNLKGKIVKNGDSSKDLQQYDNRHQNTTKKQQIYSDRDMEKIHLLPNHKPNTQHNYFEQSQPFQSNRLETPRENSKNGLPVKQVSHTEPRSPQNRRNYDPNDRSLSPIVVDYQPPEDSEQIEEEQSPPIYIDEGYYGAYQRQKMFRNLNNSDYSKGKDDDRMRTAPTPIEKSLQKKVEESEWPPSYKDIPMPNSKYNKQPNPQIISKKLDPYSNKDRNRQQPRKVSNDSPIIVPISKLPDTSRRKSNTRIQPKKVKLSISSVTKTLNIIEQPKYDETTAQKDRFVISKQRYLDKLQRQEREKTRLGQSRTLSRSRRSLSPECERITNRLHYTQINKQPCAKFVDYIGKIKRMEIREMLTDYSFIRRYLSDRQIWEILGEFQRQGIPERKWPSKLVDLVYQKLKSFKTY